MSKKMKQLIIFSVSIIASAILFFYLLETLLVWRLFFAIIMFLSTYIMFDGFVKYR
ncbi:MAG: hypothetical protein PHI72_08545 [Atribacterota bacterium]|nr:hypothetical protein [Atribacterota bacterium]MDD5636226.1 hypothetical protein [Atribacterota bacterium]